MSIHNLASSLLSFSGLLRVLMTHCMVMQLNRPHGQSMCVNVHILYRIT